MSNFSPEACHEHLLQTLHCELSYPSPEGLETWRHRVETKLRELIGATPQRVPLNVRREYVEEHEECHETRFVFTAEERAEVPCHLLIPKRGKPPFPVVICLQGHSTGMHISLGHPKYEGDETLIHGGDRDFALQAVREGYAALAMEQRCFGERRDLRPDAVRHIAHGCHHASMTALLLGRTMIGERVWDVSRAIDALGEFPQIDTDRIGCMGNSGGGTITWFAACLEPRIRIAMPSSYVCTFRESIARIDHCMDNYIPGFLRWFDLDDLACLIAPRPLVVVAGREDTLFPIAGVETAYAKIAAIYAAAGVPDRCRLVIGEGGHRFYAQMSWPVFRSLSGWSVP